LFYYRDTCAPSIHTLSLHDALPISRVVELQDQPVDADQHQDVSHAGIGNDGEELAAPVGFQRVQGIGLQRQAPGFAVQGNLAPRSEEHTSELQSREKLVCRLLLEKK